MKKMTFKIHSLVLLTTGLLTLTTAQEERCLEENARFSFNLEDCRSFYFCVNKRAIKMYCPSDLVFSLSLKRCVFKTSEYAKECQMAVSPTPDTTPTPTTSPATITQDSPSNLGFVKGGKADTAFVGKLDDPKPGRGFATEIRCMSASSQLVAHERFCHRYFNCSQSHEDGFNRFLTPYEYECDYPKLFSLKTMQCEDYDKVDCGQRKVFKDPCEYSKNMCSGPNCRPCNSEYPSCVGKPNGKMYWPGREGSGFWVNCKDERVLSQGNCRDVPGRMMVFSEKLNNCAPYSDVVDEICQYKSGRLAHVTDCHKYYDCSAKNDQSEPSDAQTQTADKTLAYVKICPYPQLYSIQTGKCEDYSIVECGSRNEAKTPCEYMKTPCDDKSYASCVGMKDGFNVYKSREGSPWYVRCKDERTVEKLMCGEDEMGLYKQYAPGLGICVSVKS